MKKKTVAEKRTAVAKAKPYGLAPLIAEVRQLIQSARRGASSVIDTFQVMTNFEIGRRIVEHEQKGEKRAGYGQEMLKALSARLTEEFGRGFSVTNLQLMRKFFIENKNRFQQQPAVKSRSPFTLRRDKAGATRLARRGQLIIKQEDLLKEALMR
jgi:DUF1016 N-terminal domain